MIGVAAGAIYVVTQSEAKMYFTIENQEPDTLPVISMFECGAGWSNSCSLGTLTSRSIDQEIRHENTQAEPFVGIVYIDIECEQGMMADMSGMRDFSIIEFTDPHGNRYQCDDLDCIEMIDPALNSKHIRITPTNNTYSFDPSTYAYSNIRIDFENNAYGDYLVTAYVDAAPA